MLRIRLRRVGSKGQPSYRIVVADSRSPRDGRFIEKIGFYNPRTEPATVEFDEARTLYWLSQGAKPSDAVDRMLGWSGTAERYKRLRAGEAVDALVAEAVEFNKTRLAQISQRTRRDDLNIKGVSKRAKSKAAKSEAAAAAPAPAPATEPVEEAEPVAEAVEAAEATEAAE
jgi:small subunit ribosomal protein S16